MRRTVARGFSLVEVLVISVVIVLGVGVLIPSIVRQRRQARENACKKNLGMIGVAFKTWTLDASDKYPMQIPAKEGGSIDAIATGETFRHFQIMSNELGTPKVLICLRDERRPARSFGPAFTNTNISYFVAIDASDNFPEMLLAGDRNLTNGALCPNRTLQFHSNSLVGWTHELHNLEGHVLLCDGSVSRFNTPSIRKHFQRPYVTVETNRLAMP